MTTDPGIGDQFTFANALATLLTTESLLFAALALAANLSTPGGRRIRDLPVSGEALGAASVAVLALVAVGAVTAWGNIFLSPFPGRLDEIVICVSLLVAIVAQPVLATLLALGLRTRR